MVALSFLRPDLSAPLHGRQASVRPAVSKWIERRETLLGRQARSCRFPQDRTRLRVSRSASSGSSVLSCAEKIMRVLDGLAGFADCPFREFYPSAPRPHVRILPIVRPRIQTESVRTIGTTPRRDVTPGDHTPGVRAAHHLVSIAPFAAGYLPSQHQSQTNDFHLHSEWRSCISGRANSCSLHSKRRRKSNTQTAPRRSDRQQ